MNFIRYEVNLDKIILVSSTKHKIDTKLLCNDTNTITCLAQRCLLEKLINNDMNDISMDNNAKDK